MKNKESINYIIYLEGDDGYPISADISDIPSLPKGTTYYYSKSDCQQVCDKHRAINLLIQLTKDEYEKYIDESNILSSILNTKHNPYMNRYFDVTDTVRGPIDFNNLHNYFLWYLLYQSNAINYWYPDNKNKMIRLDQVLTYLKNIHHFYRIQELSDLKEIQPGDLLFIKDYGVTHSFDNPFGVDIVINCTTDYFVIIHYGKQDGESMESITKKKICNKTSANISKYIGYVRL